MALRISPKGSSNKFLKYRAFQRNYILCKIFAKITNSLGERVETIRNQRARKSGIYAGHFFTSDNYSPQTSEAPRHSHKARITVSEELEHTRH